jgi:3-oxoacyl-[acyl-carrier-protein] synthase II
VSRAGAAPVAVTGMGLITALGTGVAANWAAMRSGRSGVALIRRFATEGLRTRFAACVDVPGFEADTPAERAELMAARAAEEALLQSGLHPDSGFPGPLVIGLPPVQLEWPDRFRIAHLAGGAPESYADLVAAAGDPRLRPIRQRLRFGETGERLAERFGTRGPPISISTACASGASAIQIGMEAIRRGETETVLAIGADASVSPEMLARFGLLSALSRQNDAPERASRPFDAGRDGFVPGEGAAALVLEAVPSAERRGARILGLLRGAGERLDGHHRLRHSPDAGPMTAAMAAAIRDAGLTPDDIDYVCAHGTSTPENDRVEALGLHRLFGDRMPKVPVSSVKSMIGHTMSAAGAIEAVATLMMLSDELLLPTINHDVPDPEIILDVVPNVARRVPLRHALSNAFGFGGQNVCLVLSHA